MTDDVRTPMSPIVFLLVAAAFVVLMAGMRAAEAIVVPFLLSVFIAIIASPPLIWLRQHQLPLWLSYGVITLVVIIFGLILTLLIAHSIGEFAAARPEYDAKLERLSQKLAESSLLEKLGLDDKVSEVLNPKAALSLVGTLFTQLGNLLANSLLIVLTVAFILLEQSVFSRKVRAIAVDPESSLAQFRKFASNINSYMAIKTLTSIATGVIIGVWLAILGVDFAILWGLLAFFLNFIPNLGSILAAIPGTLVAFVQLGWGIGLACAAGYAVVNVVVGNILEPRIMGRGLGLSTLVVFLSLVFWGWMFGPLGMLLSVPLTMTIKIALESSPDTRWIAILLCAEPPRVGGPEKEAKAIPS